MNLSRDAIIEALKTVMDPELKRDLVSLGMIKEIAIDNGKISIGIELTTPACPLKERIEADVRKALSAVPGITDVRITMTGKVAAQR